MADRKLHHSEINRTDLEFAITDALASARLVEVTEALFLTLDAHWDELGVEPRAGFSLFLVPDDDAAAFSRALGLLKADVAAISLAFFGPKQKASTDPTGGAA